MSCSPEFPVIKAAASEKPNFSQKCSLLSQYLKENGSFGHLNFSISPNNSEASEKSSPATTMNLFPIVEKAGDVLPWNVKYGSNVNPNMGLFPHQGSYGTASSDGSKPDTKEPETAQMTIFYAGQVIVFNDFPAEKAKEIMLFSDLQKAGNSQPPAASYPLENQNAAGNVIPPPTPTAGPNFRSGVIPEHIRPPSDPILCDLPIARKASLHRFLEKRKDRINSKALYKISSPPKPVESEGASRVGLERDLFNNLSPQ